MLAKLTGSVRVQKIGFEGLENGTGWRKVGDAIRDWVRINCEWKWFRVWHVHAGKRNAGVRRMRCSLTGMMRVRANEGKVFEEERQVRRRNRRRLSGGDGKVDKNVGND